MYVVMDIEGLNQKVKVLRMQHSFTCSFDF